MKTKILMIIFALGASIANAQSCRDYKPQLESLLVLPAGKYEVKYRAEIQRKVIKRGDGTESVFYLPAEVGAAHILPEPYTYRYNIPRTQLKVTDSTTNGIRIASGNVSCAFHISAYQPSEKPSVLELDVKVSDNGNATFFVPPNTGLASISPLIREMNAMTGPIQVTSKTGQTYVLNKIAEFLKERDSEVLWKHANQEYEKAYREAVAKQPEEDLKRKEALDMATPKEHNCKPAKQPSFWIPKHEREASVSLKLLIDPEGRVLRTTFTKNSDTSLNLGNLRQAAVEYYEGCGFSPGTIDGNPIRAWTREYTFQWNK